MSGNQRSTFGGVLGLIASAVAASACLSGSEPDGIVGSTSEAASVTQGSMYQGSMYQGSSLQGSSARFWSFSISGVAVVDGHLAGSFEGRTGVAALLTPISPFHPGMTIRSEVTFRIDGSTTHVPDLIDAATPWNKTSEAMNANADIVFYHASYQTSAGWLPLCPAENEAIALRGTFNHGVWEDSGTSFTLGCTNGVLAKCVRWGYKPWAQALANGVEVDLGPLHRACANAAVANYCHDGQSHTVDGTHIDLFDVYGIIAPDPASVKTEASFGETGATCINTVRIQSLPACSCVGSEHADTVNQDPERPAGCGVPFHDSEAAFAECAAANPAPIIVRDYD